MTAPTTQRAIIVTLNQNGPMSAKAIAVAIDRDWRGVANQCSAMSGAGLLTEHPNEQGGRRGRRYGASVKIHPADMRALADLVKAYSAKSVRRLALIPGDDQ